MQEMEHMSFEYARVYILDNPYSIDDTYEYFIPIQLRPSVIRGSFVMVPFGRSNRKQMALVWELCKKASYSKVKSIEYVCTDRLPLKEDILSLCDFMRKQVLCSVGDAVRTAVPSAALVKLTEYYYPSDKPGPDPSAGFSPADLFVYEHIVKRKYVSLSALSAKFGAVTTDEAVRKLFSKKYILRDIKPGNVNKGNYEISYELTLDAENTQKVIDGDGVVKLRSQKQKDILKTMLTSPCGIKEDDLLEKCNASKDQLKALEDKGLLSKTSKRIYRGVKGAIANTGEYILNEEQNAAYSKIKEFLSDGTPHAVLLHGVTGSGKTSVILKAIDETIALGKGVIVLLPEIALTPQTLSIFGSRYGERVALVHSSLSQSERYDTYARILAGEADIVIGTRSAVFSPVKNIGLIVIDEEHETTYKSDTVPKYHARDIARFRCAYGNAVLLLSSATPSIESYTKAKLGKYTLLSLEQRYGKAKLPEVEIYDMRSEITKGNISPLGERLKEELGNTLGRGEQAVLFLNRRGYNTMLSCRVCGDNIKCPHCSVSMSYHTVDSGFDKGYLFCHLCGTKMNVPLLCPTCGSEHIAKLGFGTQRIEQELSTLFPDARILRMDADSISKNEPHEKKLSAFRAHEYDILLGTQMVTKGHDFPDVTLVGVLLADMSLYLDDYHANERTFSMLTQVIGRAGRASKPGKAIIQTNNPDSDVIKLACKQDYINFYNHEIRLRKALTFPPYCDIALLTLTSADEPGTVAASQRLRRQLEDMTNGEFCDVEAVLFGPFEAPVYKVEEKYRMRIVVKIVLNRRSREMFSRVLKSFGKEGKNAPQLSIDFNPSGL